MHVLYTHENVDNYVKCIVEHIFVCPMCSHKQYDETLLIIQELKKNQAKIFLWALESGDIKGACFFSHYSQFVKTEHLLLGSL